MQLVVSTVSEDTAVVLYCWLEQKQSSSPEKKNLQILKTECMTIGRCLNGCPHSKSALDLG